jgi:hypothetical protein
MSMQSEGKDAKGRNYDQVTKDGSTSAGSYGTGATGDVGSMGGNDGGNVQRATRTDDLLSPAPDEEIGQEGFTPGEQAGELQTGLGGIGSLATGNAGNRQSDGAANIGGKPGSQHNDWGHSDAGGGVGTQSNQQSNQQLDQQSDLQELQAQLQPDQQSSQQPGAGANIGGVAGGQHKDWGHSPVAGEGNQQSRGDGNAQSARPDARQSPRQGVMPGEEMAHLQRSQDGGATKR